MTTVMWLMLGVGAVVGFLAGRWWAEVAAARWAMSKTWRGRRGYRGRD